MSQTCTTRLLGGGGGVPWVGVRVGVGVLDGVAELVAVGVGVDVFVAVGV
ncbi:MAG TPA: hypothetical protein PKJ34_10640 [Anaerolineaceae bacterium]|nr:hypothetical protein [Anaerolineaceae bacterium]HOH21565.1 hypothetical protein [Anaerolineaceae bacterium]